MSPLDQQHDQNKTEDTNHDHVNASAAVVLLKEAKQNFLQILNNHGNDTSDPNVAAAIDDLGRKWQILRKQQGQGSAPGGGGSGSETEPHLITKMKGKWIQSSAPIFPNAIKDPDAPGKFKYTLGRLSFNLFQPKNLVCTLDGTTNLIDQFDPPSSAVDAETKEAPGVATNASADSDTSSEDETNEGAAVAGDDLTYTYNFLQHLIVHAEKRDLPATLLVEGKCLVDPKKNDRVSVVFTSGQLRRGDEVDRDVQVRKIWDETFHEAYATAEKERGYISTFGMWLMKLAFKLTLPMDTDGSSDDYCARYEMKRAPKGYIDILYIDEDLRITRGNRGSIVVVRKVKE